MAARSKRRPARAAKAPKRWLLLVFALALGAGAFWALLRGEAPLDRHDAHSRARLERVLEESDREAGP